MARQRKGRRRDWSHCGYPEWRVLVWGGAAGTVRHDGIGSETVLDVGDDFLKSERQRLPGTRGRA